MSRPLCVLMPEIGLVSETFVRWDARDLLPGGTVVVADPPPAGASVLGPPAWDTRDIPTLAFDPLPGDPAPSPDRVRQVINFLSGHGTNVVLVEYLDFADRWFDHLTACGVHVWLRGHGVDLSARLQDPRMQRAYQRYAEAAGIIVPSKVAADVLASLGLPAEMIHVIPYGVELPSTISPVSEGVIRCVAVGRLVPKKAPILMLQAFHRGATTNPSLSLDLIGDGPLADEVRHYVHSNNLGERVRLHGSLPHTETLALIRRSQLLLHHAVRAPGDGDSEGLPLVILEAMAAGITVIATRHAGIPEAIQDHNNGRLVDEGDLSGMADTLIELAADAAERQRLGDAARETARRRHTHDRARTTLLQLLGLSGTPQAATG